MFKINGTGLRITAAIISLCLLATLIACRPSVTPMIVTETRTTTVPVTTTATETTSVTTIATTTEIVTETTTETTVAITTVTVTVTPETETATTLESFVGVISGTWSGQKKSGGAAGGDFSFSIDEWGNIEGNFDGSYEGYIVGIVDSEGNLTALGRTLIGEFYSNISWHGKISVVGDNLLCIGDWSFELADGTFSGTGSAAE